MNIDISARHFQLTQGIRDHLQAKFDAVEHITPVMSARVVLDHDDHRSAAQYLVKAHVNLRGENLNVEVRAADLYAGIDLAVEKLTAQLRKIHDRHSRHGGEKLAAAE